MKATGIVRRIDSRVIIRQQDKALLYWCFADFVRNSLHQNAKGGSRNKFKKDEDQE